MDHIDLCVCRVFEVSPEILLSNRRNERLVLARFTAMYIRHSAEVPIDQIASIYRKDRNTVTHAIRRVTDLLKYNKPYREQYNICISMIDTQKLPYNPALLRIGAKVWTRADSLGQITEGTVIAISSKTFRVGSFHDPHYSSRHRTNDGRINGRYESSQDIAFIEPPPDYPM